MPKRLRGALMPLALTLVLIPAVVALAEDFFTPGQPCHAERTTYYSDASRTTVVGVDEYICWQGHRVWGQRTAYYRYRYIGQCCEVCTNTGVCGIQP